MSTEGGKSGPTLRAIPHLIQSSFGLGKTKLVWHSDDDHRLLEVHVNAPSGPLLASSVGSGDKVTGPWVTDGMTFFLQDPSQSADAQTLDQIVVGVVANHDTLAEFGAVLAAGFGTTHIVDAAALCPTSVNQLSIDFQILPHLPPGNLAEHVLVLCRDRGDVALDLLLRDLDHARIAILSVPVHSELLATAANPIAASRLLEEWLRARSIHVAFTGVSPPDAHQPASVVAVLECALPPRPAVPPPSFRVAVIMSAYNEEDIIVPAIQRLLQQGIAVHLLENWSTDATYELAQTLSHEELFSMERFPKDGPSRTYDWQTMLSQTERLSQEIRADWFVHQDADEIRSSPWPGVGLREAYYRVEQAGFNCVDHTLLEFRPTDNSFAFGGDLERHLQWFEFGRRPDQFTQIKAWKNLGIPVSLSASGGHEVQFPGRRVFPYKFLCQHYPIRSQLHGEKKVHDRQTRWNPEERAKGWHIHYDGIETGHNFLRDPAELIRFDRDDFYRRYVMQRLSGVGLPLVDKSDKPKKC